MEATLRKTGALLGKDLKDVVKNPTMLVCCLLPVGFMLFYKNAVGGGMEGEAAEAFSSMLVSWSLLFTATMVASMATLNAIAEEKEKHTLRTLMLANVSAEQMLASRGLVTLLAIALVDAACYLVIGQQLAGLPAFLAIGVAGSVPIVLLSLLLGLVARDQMSAGVLSMPILVAGIAPMFAQMVDGLSDIAPLPAHRRHERAGDASGAGRAVLVRCHRARCHHARLGGRGRRGLRPALPAPGARQLGGCARRTYRCGRPPTSRRARAPHHP